MNYQSEEKKPPGMGTILLIIAVLAPLIYLGLLAWKTVWLH